MKLKTYLRSLFNLNLRSSASKKLLQDPFATVLQRPVHHKLHSTYSASMYYETPEYEMRNITVHFDAVLHNHPPTLHTAPEREASLSIGTTYLHESEAVMLKVAVARALADVFTPPWSDNSFTANERKTAYYADDIYRRAVHGTSVRRTSEDDEEYTECDALSLVRRSDHTAALNTLRARFFAVVRGGAMRSEIAADRLAARYCSKKDVSVYLTNQMATEPGAANLELINRIKTLNASIDDLAPLQLGLVGKTFVSVLHPHNS